MEVGVGEVVEVGGVGLVHGLVEVHLAIYLHGWDLDGSSVEVPAGGCYGRGLLDGTIHTLSHSTHHHSTHTQYTTPYTHGIRGGRECTHGTTRYTHTYQYMIH